MGSLTVTCTHDPARFVERAGTLLLAHPVEHSVLLTRSAQALEQTNSDAGPRRDVEPDLWLWVEDDQGQVVAAAMQTPPYPVALSLASPEAVVALAGEVRRRRPEVPGVGGLLPGPWRFAERWAELGGGAAQVHTRLGLYAADAVTAPTGVAGSHRLAQVDDAALLQSWAEAFEVETDATASGTDHVSSRLAKGLLHVWQDGGRVVSMAAATSAHGGVSRVQLVYTPPELRGHGFASACVAAVTARELAAGRSTMLNTDLANPTSNAIYQRIGYRWVAEAVSLRLS